MKWQLSESELYQYEEGSDKPAKDFDHALDALRYLIFKARRQTAGEEEMVLAEGWEGPACRAGEAESRTAVVECVERAALDEGLWR
jgi:hypothetical protein